MRHIAFLTALMILATPTLGFACEERKWVLWFDQTRATQQDMFEAFQLVTIANGLKLSGLAAIESRLYFNLTYTDLAGRSRISPFKIINKLNTISRGVGAYCKPNAELPFPGVAGRR